MHKKYVYKYKKDSGRKSDISPLKSIIDELLKTHHIKKRYYYTQIGHVWERLMGAPIAKRTPLIYLKNKQLFIKIDSPPLKQELLFSKQKIVEILNRDYQDILIEEIFFL